MANIPTSVLWKITPLFAEWISSPSSVLQHLGILQTGQQSPFPSIIELGCGISPLSGLALAPRVARYVLTDQSYVKRLITQNLEENQSSTRTNASRGKKTTDGSVVFHTLDWEKDRVTSDLVAPAAQSFDAVVVCDCVYNEALVRPLVQTCVDVCRLREADETGNNAEPCVCVVAQQLRDNDVFEAWLTAFHESFRVWRVSDALLPEELRPDSGFAIHVGLLR